MKKNARNWLSVAHGCTVSASLTVLCAAIVLLGLPQVGPAIITYPTDTEHAPTKAELPYTDATRDGATFTAEIPVRLTPLSSGTIQFAPDDCIEAYSIDGGKPQNLSETDRRRRCWPNSYPLDVASVGEAGTHVVRLTIKNTSGPHGINAQGSITTPVTLVACFVAWLALAFPVWPWLMNPTGSVESGVCRHVRRLAICSVGVVFTAGSQLNAEGSVSFTHGRFIVLAACGAAVALLFAALDRSSNRPLTRRPSAGWAAVSFIAFSGLALAAQRFQPITSFVVVILGVSASVFTVTPFFDALDRLRQAPAAGAIAVLGAALPLIYEQCYRALWGWLVWPTTCAVAAVVRMFGHTVSTNFGTRLDDAGDVWDHYGYVTTPEFSIQIGAWCGGFEGMTLFLFLLSSFVLLDWRFFSRLDRLWIPFAATIPYLFAVNVLRIAAILVYALLISGEVDQDAARQAAVEMFHSNAGWVIYSLAFGPYLWAVYRWAKRSAARRAIR